MELKQIIWNIRRNIRCRALYGKLGTRMMFVDYWTIFCDELQN